MNKSLDWQIGWRNATILLWSILHLVSERVFGFVRYYRTLPGFLHSLLSGTIFSLVYYLTDFNLLTPMIAHAFYNFLIWLSVAEPFLSISALNLKGRLVALLSFLSNLFSKCSPKIKLSSVLFKVLLLSVLSLTLLPTVQAASYWLDENGTALTTGLVGYWKFSEGSGSATNDSSGYNNHGTLTSFDFNATSGWTDGFDSLTENLFSWKINYIVGKSTSDEYGEE